jgi:hypothetical protein
LVWLAGPGGLSFFKIPLKRVALVAPLEFLITERKRIFQTYLY